MIVYKKAVLSTGDEVIVRMEVNKKLVIDPEGDMGKMRAKSVMVLGINLPHSPSVRFKQALSAQYAGYHTPRTLYTVGKRAVADGLNKNLGDDCGQGINFFRTRKEAVDYVGR